MPTTTPTREVYWNIQGIWIMYALVVVATIVFGYGAYRYYRLLMAGQPANRFDQPGRRIKAVLAHALAQGRTLQRRYSGFSHLLFSWGFVVLFIGTVVVFIHEDLGALHPVFRIMQGNFYLVFQSLILDILGLGAVIGLALTMLRRFNGPEARHDRLYRPGDPRSILDDWVILGGFQVILLTGFVIEGARIIATADPWAAWSPVGYAVGLGLAGLGIGEGGLRGLHLGLWWFHLVLALGWLAYLPYSKLRHIFAAPANIYFQPLEPKGALPFIDIEKAFEQEPPPIGLSKLADLTWKDRLDVQACTECTRCEIACPAARTGKALSPMLLVLDLRNQLLVGSGPAPYARTRKARGDEGDGTANVTPDGKVNPALAAPGALRPATAAPAAEGEEAAAATAVAEPETDAAPIQLVGDVITDAVLWDCTTCRACMEACPVMIEHVPKIVEMRRHLVLVESRFEPELQRLFDNLEAAGNPWRFPRSDRANWRAGLDTPVPILGQDVTADEIDVLYWVGCAGSYDERNQKVARSLAGLLQTAGIRFAILGTGETCTGDPARRAGNEYLWQILAGENVATLNELGMGKPEDGSPPQKTILASCPHCFNTLKDEYPQLGGMYTVRHHAEYLAELVRDGKLQPHVPLEGNASVAYHDPCYLGRYQDIYDQPREVLDAIPGLERKEVRAGCRRNAMCCGAGGAKIWFEERRGTRVNHLRMEQIQDEQPDQVAVACPYCMIMLEDGARAKGVFETLPILDISEFLTNSLAARTNGGGTSSLDSAPTE
ncbi:MAG: heterodisulfide reductase-related iron-sulfur binding cluster [Chloroflexota bacterium]